jgi:hypothetical protein
MSQFEDCLRSAMRQGFKMSAAEFDDLVGRFEEHRAARAAAGERDPDMAAKTALIAEQEADAARKRAIATGQAEAVGRITEFAKNYRDLDGKPTIYGAFSNLMESFGGGTTSWRNRAEAIARQTHGEVAEFLSNFRRSRLTGARFNKPGVEDVVREQRRGEGHGTGHVRRTREAAH